MVSSSKAHIYYYSGTGNTYRASLFAKEELESMGVETQLFFLNHRLPVEGAEEAIDFLGVLSPVHAFTIPFPVFSSILSLPSYTKNTKALIIITRGGTRARGFHIPGFEGTAAYLLALLLKMKGISIVGVMGVDMPSNWTVFSPGLNDQDVAIMRDGARVKVRDFVKSLVLEKTIFKGRLSLLLGIFLLPLSLAYLLYGRFFLAKLFFANKKCVGCGLCVQNCPHQAIKKVKGRPYWTYKCASCMRCMAYCMKGAVEASHSFALLLFLSFLPLGYLAIELLGPSLSFHLSFLQIIVQYLGSLGLISLLYFFFHYLLGIPFINTLFTKTSLTHYFRKYHDPETKAKELVLRQRRRKR